MILYYDTLFQNLLFITFVLKFLFMFKKRWHIVFLLSLWYGTIAAQLNTDRLLSIGRNALYFEDYILSIQYFNQIINTKPYLIEPYYFRAIAKLQLEDFSGAERDIDEVLKRNPFYADAFYVRGFARKNMNLLSEAEKDFIKALEFSPENLSITLNLIEVREKMEQYDEVLIDLDHLIKKTNNLTILELEKARILFLKADTTEALKIVTECIKKDSLSDEAWSYRALLRLQTNDQKGALEDYNKAIELNQTNANYFINRGLLNYYAKHYRDALSDYDKAIELNPYSQISLFNRALLRAEVGDLNNAIEDLNDVLKINPDYDEALFKRALLFSELNYWQEAEDDYSLLIQRYPYFIPAYYGRHQVRQQLGKNKLAYLDLEKIDEIEKNKEKIKKDTITTTAQYAEMETIKDKIKEFNNTNGNDFAKSKYENVLRGAVQNQFSNIVNERNFVLSYYSEKSPLTQIEHFYPMISEINKMDILPGELKLTNKEISLTTPLITYHTQSLDQFSYLIQQNENNPYLYLGRGIDYTLVQDFNSAIDDFSKAILLDSELSLAYFCRANVRYKQLEFQINAYENENKLDKKENLPINKKYAYDFELIIRDYDKTLSLTPDFDVAWFNKANILGEQKNFEDAIFHYTKAIEINPEFAHAYFNRGLMLFFVGKTNEGLADLSKAGELGIYQSYNIIKRLK